MVEDKRAPESERTERLKNPSFKGGEISVPNGNNREL